MVGFGDPAFGNDLARVRLAGGQVRHLVDACEPTLGRNTIRLFQISIEGQGETSKRWIILYNFKLIQYAGKLSYADIKNQ